MFVHQMAALFCVKWQHGHHLESVTSNQKSDLSVDAYLYEKHSCQVSFQSDLKRESLRVFCRGCPNNKKKNKMMSSDMRSVPDVKSIAF